MRGSLYVNMMGNDNKTHRIYLNKFRKLYIEKDN